jgi:hypothetical protein
LSFEYLSDSRPNIGSDGVDAFGHRDYANTVVAEMEHFPAQFTLGLFGAWGSGKSMILDEIGKRLKNPGDSKTAFVIFDAWRYEGDSLRRELIRAVGQSLREQDTLRKAFDFERHIEAFETETTTARRSLRPEWRALVSSLMAALLVLGFAFVLIVALHKLGATNTTREKILLTLAGVLAAFMLFPLRRLVVPDPVQATRRRLEFPDQFARNFGELLNNVTAERLVIAIDNLDRCSPARVTEILSSIKTFLEPAFKGSIGEPQVSWLGWLRRRLPGAAAEGRPLERMCFIVAADDAALRRHLTAQELSKAGGSGEVDGASGEPGRGQAGLPAEVSASVEEYLRKFFGASLRIRELLDEDVRKFIGEQLESFVESRNLEGELADEVIEMTSQGLKRNPRRIKQFVNNLQLRLQMLAERKAQGRIQIDADVRVVAKLAILEEEFPSEFEELEADPALLVSWHAQAGSDEVAAAEPGGRELRSELASFLRFTDHIQPRDIRAYLNLKQTESEVNLPRHSEFVELLDGGEVEKLAELLRAEAAEEAAYTEAARSHFREQCRAMAWNRAHNTLRSIVEVPVLHGDGGKVFKAVLQAALREPSLATRLGQLEPNALLDAVARHKLTMQTANSVVKQLVQAIGSQQGEARRRISAALASHAAAVSQENRQQIATILVTEDVTTDFDSYLSLATAMPEVVRAEVLDAALTRIEELGTEGISMSSAAFKVALAALRSSRDDERLERLLQLARTSLAAHRDANSEELGSVANELASAVDAGAPTPSMTDLANWLVSDWAAVPSGSRLRTIDLVLALCRQSSDAATAVGGTLADRMFELDDGDETVARLTRDFATLTDEAQNRVRVLTAEALAGAKPDVPEDKADQLLVLFPPETQAALIGDALETAVAAERGEVARTLLNMLSKDDQEQRIVAVLSRAEQAPAERMADMRFAVSHQARIDEERLFQFATVLAHAVHEKRDIVTTIAPFIGELKLADADRRMQIVERLLTTELDMSDENNREAMLRAAWNLAGKRRSKAREAITSRLEQIRNEGGGRMGAVASELLDAS